MPNADPSLPKPEPVNGSPVPPSRDELLSRAFIEAGYHAPDVRVGILRTDSYWLGNNVGILGLALGKSDSAKARRSALTPLQRRDEFNALMYLQAAPLIEVTRAMRNYCRRLDAAGRPVAFEEFMEFAVEPALATLPPECEAALSAQIREMNEVVAALVNVAAPPSRDTNRPDVRAPNTSGQADSPPA